VEVGQGLVLLRGEGVLVPTEVLSRVEGRLGVWARNDRRYRVEQSILGEDLSVDRSCRTDDVRSIRELPILEVVDVLVGNENDSGRRHVRSNSLDKHEGANVL